MSLKDSHIVYLIWFGLLYDDTQIYDFFFSHINTWWLKLEMKKLGHFDVRVC